MTAPPVSSPALAPHRLCRLSEAPQGLEPLVQAFQAEWPGWYGPQGQGDARADLQAFAQPGSTLPIGLVVLDRRGQACGVAALKARSVASHPHLGPWASAGWVAPGLRRQGLGAQLLRGLVDLARALGYPALYCATATARSLLEREGWQLLEETVQDERSIFIFVMPMAP